MRFFPALGRDHAPGDFRRKLVLGGVGLILFAGILIGLVSTATVGKQLLDNLDQDLRNTATRLAATLKTPGDSVMGPRGRLNRPGFDVGTLIVVVNPDQVSGAFIDSRGELSALPESDLDEFAKVEWHEGEPLSVHLDGGYHEVRTLLVGEYGDSQLVVGLPMSDIRFTIARLTAVIFAIIAVVIVVAGVLGFWGLRLALRPLDRIRRTAQSISSQPLSDSQSRILERIPDALANPRTEIGQLGASINFMLDHVDASLVARTRSEEKLRQFVSDASHELRTPLASIRGYSEITLRHDQKLPSQVRQSLSRIESESIRMSHLVEELLLLARLDEGDSEEMERVDVASLLREVASDAEVRAPKHLWSITIPRRAVRVMGRRDQLVQVVTNLIQNAIVHTSEGTTVSVSLVKSGQTALLRVADNGPGIPEELQPHLFERFRRADKGRSRQAGSTGLGLAIVQAIVQAHHGRVSVTSSPGSTEFRVELPLAGSR